MNELTTHTQVCPKADDVIATLRAHEAELRAAGIKRLSLFGSVARGDAGPDSDVEFAVVLDPGAHIGLIGLSALERRVGDLVGRKVELVPEPVETRPHAETLMPGQPRTDIRSMGNGSLRTAQTGSRGARGPGEYRRGRED